MADSAGVRVWSLGLEASGRDVSERVVKGSLGLAELAVPVIPPSPLPTLRRRLVCVLQLRVLTLLESWQSCRTFPTCW